MNIEGNASTPATGRMKQEANTEKKQIPTLTSTYAKQTVADSEQLY